MMPEPNFVAINGVTSLWGPHGPARRQTACPDQNTAMSKPATARHDPGARSIDRRDFLSQVIRVYNKEPFQLARRQAAAQQWQQLLSNTHVKVSM